MVGGGTMFIILDVEHCGQSAMLIMLCVEHGGQRLHTNQAECRTWWVGVPCLSC